MFLIQDQEKFEIKVPIGAKYNLCRNYGMQCKYILIWNKCTLEKHYGQQKCF